MFTSRAEFRLQLRQDNADLRLGDIAIRLGLYDQSRKIQYETRRDRLASCFQAARKTTIGTGVAWGGRLARLGLPLPSQAMKLTSYCHRDDVRPDLALALLEGAQDMDVRDLNSLLAMVHYDGYLDKQQIEVERFKQLEKQSIAKDFDYSQVRGLSIECCQRLKQAQPRTLGQASRLSGITPAALTSLVMHLRQKKHVA